MIQSQNIELTSCLYGQIWLLFGPHMDEGEYKVNAKRENFVRLAEARVGRAIDSIRIIGNLSNRSNYSYNEQDVQKIVRALQEEINTLLKGLSEGEIEDGTVEPQAASQNVKKFDLASQERIRSI